MTSIIKSKNQRKGKTPLIFDDRSSKNELDRIRNKIKLMCNTLVYPIKLQRFDLRKQNSTPPVLFFVPCNKVFYLYFYIS